MTKRSLICEITGVTVAGVAFFALTYQGIPCMTCNFKAARMDWFHKATFSVKPLERQESEPVNENFKMLPLDSNQNGPLQVS